MATTGNDKRDRTDGLSLNTPAPSLSRRQEDNIDREARATLPDDDDYLPPVRPRRDSRTFAAGPDPQKAALGKGQRQRLSRSAAEKGIRKTVRQNDGSTSRQMMTPTLDEYLAINRPEPAPPSPPRPADTRSPIERLRDLKRRFPRPVVIQYEHEAGNKGFTHTTSVYRPALIDDAWIREWRTMREGGARCANPNGCRQPVHSKGKCRACYFYARDPRHPGVWRSALLINRQARRNT
jgi:hypothetical protein